MFITTKQDCHVQKFEIMETRLQVMNFKTLKVSVCARTHWWIT